MIRKTQEHQYHKNLTRDKKPDPNNRRQINEISDHDVMDNLVNYGQSLSRADKPDPLGHTVIPNIDSVLLLWFHLEGLC